MKKCFKFWLLLGIFLALVFNLPGKTYCYTPTIQTTPTGVSGDTVTVNDLVSDYYYYMAKNYTYNTGSLPTLEDKGIYSSSNLVEAKLTYNGTDILGNNHGYVSITERQDKYIYYKVFPVNNNGTTSLSDDYIEIELPDNIFTDRPTNKGFGGWMSNYPGTTLSLDRVHYVRSIKIKVTYTDGIPNPMDINFYAIWVDAEVQYLSNVTFAEAFDEFNNFSMLPVGGQIPVYESVIGLYTRGTISYNNNYPSGAVNSSGNSLTGRCTSWFSSCTYYLRVNEDPYDPTVTYYQLRNNNMYTYTIGIDHYDELPRLPVGSSPAGYFKPKTFSNGQSVNGYYSSAGELQTNRNCTTSGGCTYYELLNYYDNNNNQILADGSIYYYLATRDTNILVMDANSSSKWSSSQTKPFTLTGAYNGTDHNATWTVSSQYITCYGDTAIENLRINSSQSSSASTSPSTSATTTRNIYGNYPNLKIGRGIKQSSSYKTFNNVFGGNNSTSTLGSSSNITRYRLIVESGFYNNITLTNGPNSSSNAKYIEALGIYGNDYDRANSNNNNNLDVYYVLGGTWGSGNYYSSSTTGITFDTIVKSGKFGTGKYDHTTGIYIGGRSYGTHYTSRRIRIQGGWTYNLIGGPLTANNRGDLNDTYVYMTGGEVDMIIGGAGTSTTYGNRIIEITGGRVNYSVFGGSNAYDGSSDDGELTGSSYVYIGGTATIGNSTYVANSSKLWNAEAGSIFGIGNGRESYPSIGTNENSNIIIADECNILGNVYGGGNYSAVGISSRSNTTASNIKILGGTINGSVYGGGNNNGSGSSSIKATININVYGGEVKGSIFGGSNESGTIYGSANINAYQGKINNIYGGGEGSSTTVSENVNIVFGGTSSNLTLDNNLYGGSAFGRTNNTSNSHSNYKTNITINNGRINGKVFGGAQGSSSQTPYVLGDIKVTVNDGTVANVFGGNDLNGTPAGTVEIDLKGGTITNVYGGGNKTNLTTSNILLEGSTVTNIFGGSNEQGNVTTSNIHVISGEAGSIYGGNNIGGTTSTTHVTLDGGVITNVYGGGKLTTTGTSNIICNDSTVGTIYGGAENSDVTTSNVTIYDGEITKVYGGSNVTGTVTTSRVTINGGEISEVYGGNNVGGTTTTSHVTTNGGTVTTLYGGGNNATTGTTNITIQDGNITNVYGGGNDTNGTTSITNVNLTSGAVTYVYGGGNKATTTTSNIRLDGSNVGSIYGGGNQAGITNSNIKLVNGNATGVYGGSNSSGNVSTATITTEESSINSPIEMLVEYTLTDVDPSWQNPDYATVANVTIRIKNNTNNPITRYDGYFKLPNSEIYSNYTSTDLVEDNGTYSFTEQNKYYGTNTVPANGEYNFSFMLYSVLPKEQFKISEYKVTGYDSNNNKLTSRATNLHVQGVYGGNNLGGLTGSSTITLEQGEYGDIYGGGNFANLNTPYITLNNVTANNVYGGGNQALINNKVNVIVNNSTINGNIFGGGNLGAVANDTFVKVSASNVSGSIYGGGNGSTAIVSGKTEVVVDNNSTVGRHVFGGGNAAATGLESAHVTTEVNIGGATINGNVYGGGNTSVVYGSTTVNIGADTITKSIAKSDVLIKGTIFGGGEANEAGSEIYDFSFISVTDGTTLNINGNNHTSLSIEGSIFGSGNASSTEGDSYIYISNYGTLNNYRRNVSIQRASLVILDNSSIELLGATDRTNEYSTVLFSLSRIKHLKLKNGSTLYLQSGANLLEEYTSAYDENGTEKLATTTITENSITKKGDNKIYILEGKNLNISPKENTSAYGKVHGMTFFGMYILDRNDRVSPGMYNTSYQNGQTPDSTDVYQFTVGSYVLGAHVSNHDITKDGFYSNFVKDDVIKIEYINPTPEDSTYYMWNIGEQVITMELTITASKYITLGAEELKMLNYSNPNTTFTILGFSYNNLDSDVNLVRENQVKRIADTTEEADTVMSLVMKSTNSGWIAGGQTTFLTTPENNVLGTKVYKSENSTQIPTFHFYLYHSKNLGTSKNMGSVTISFLIVTPIDDLNNKIERVNLVVNLNRTLFSTNDYEAAMTVGKQYDMFASTDVNLTTTGSLSAYYSLYIQNENFYQTGYHRSLVSSYVFPVNTKLTLINLNERSTNEYYYYIVNSSNITAKQQEFNQNGECSYDFGDFIRMGSTSTNNKYDDALNNTLYYDSETFIVNEEFIVLVDFSDSNINSNVLDKTLLLELRNSENRAIISVLGIEQERMHYNLYKNANATIDISGSITSNKIYPRDLVKLNVITNFDRAVINSQQIYDTNYLEQKLGIRISFLDRDRNKVLGTSLLGMTYEYDGQTYYPAADGSVRIRLSDQVANVSASIKINTTDTVSSGDYIMVVESFGSPDGIYFGPVSSDSCEIPITILDTVYGLSLTMGDYSTTINKETGKNLNNNNDMIFNLKYSSNLANPNIRMSLYKRDYTTIYSTDYELVDLQDYLVQTLNTTNNSKEYLLTNEPLRDANYTYNLKENLTTGTYKFRISLYDRNVYIGSVEKYLVIKEAYSED